MYKQDILLYTVGRDTVFFFCAINLDKITQKNLCFGLQSLSHVWSLPEGNPGLIFYLFFVHFNDFHKREKNIYHILPGFVQYLILTVMLLTKLYIV